MFVVYYGNIVDGLSFVGPFVRREDAILHCTGDDTQWGIIELISPPDVAVGALSTYAKEFADQLEEISLALGEPVIGPSEETQGYVQTLKSIESSLRSI